MARPTLNPEDRRKQIAVRFGPEARMRLEQLAQEQGTSPGKVAEARASDLLAADDKTFALLKEIAEEIEEIESITGVRWHEDLTTWGMVAEMLARGPIDTLRPEIVAMDGDWIAEQREKAQIIQRKQEIIERLAVLGISASIEPAGNFRRRGGLFGGLLSHYIDRRANEQALINAISDEGIRSRAQALHDELRKFDADEEEKNGEISDTVRIYQDMEEAGRARYRRTSLERLLKRVANLKLDAKAR